MEMNSITIDKKVEQYLKEPTPDYIIEKRDGGGNKQFDYIPGATVTDMLNRAFGYAWTWEVKKEWIGESEAYFNRYAKNPKDEHKGNKGTWEPQEKIAHVLGTITAIMEINGNIVKISKDGYGAKVIMGKSMDQQYAFKSAATDALKKAASLFGIGLDLYRNENGQAYFEDINYEDPWTEELKEKYSEELQLINEYQDDNDMSSEEFAEICMNVLGTYEVTPDNIEVLVDAICGEEE